MKRLRYNIMVWSIATMVILCAGAGCQSPNLRRVNWYPYYEATVDDIPPLEDVVGIAMMSCNPNISDISLLIGDEALIESITGYDIYIDKNINDWKWIESITLHLKNAERVKNDDYNFDKDGTCITFFTRRGAYMVVFDDSDTEPVVRGPGYQSELLSRDFWELHSLLYPPKPAPKDPNDFFIVPNPPDFYEGF